jgi:hypothetical protein
LYVAAVFVLLLLLATVVAPWINVSRFRRRIVQSISEGLGRPVHVGSVSFQLFPQPAFILSDFSVAEDPAFGAEPVMTADTVTAKLRASTLWRRRVDVATLSFEDPSINLVRNAEGQWDFVPVLEHASTPQDAALEEFPYVEATGARVNFKFGNEKQPFSLMDADLALWKETTGQWHVRLKAQPVRTDLEQSDTGEVRAEAVLQYDTASGEVPITAHAEWRKAPLGGAIRLLTGNDAGWRGTVDISADATGTLAAADVALRTQVEGFRRVEFVPATEMDWEIRCKAHYARALAQFSSIVCEAPLDTGSLQLTGTLSMLPQPAGAPASASSSVQATLHQVPMNFALNLMRHVYAGVPAQASATGELNGQVACTDAPAMHSAPCTGALHTARWTLKLPDLPQPLAFSPMDIVPGSSAAPPARKIARTPLPASTLPPPQALQEAAHPAAAFIVGPIHVSLGTAIPVTITGVLTTQGHTLAVSGPATLDALLPVAHGLGWTAFPAQVRSARGDAQLKLAWQGNWSPVPASATAAGPSPNLWTGTVQLRGASIRLQDCPGHIQLVSATVQMSPEAVIWTGLHGSYLKEGFDGGLQFGTTTATDTPPSRTFHLHVDTLNAGALQTAIATAAPSSSRLLDLVGRWTGTSPALPKLTGQLLADRLNVGTFSVKNALLEMRIEGRKATISSITGAALGGALDGSGSIDWGTGGPVYQGKLSFRQIQPNAVAALFHAHSWGHGNADLDLEGTARGTTGRELEQQATASFSFQWKKGGWDAPALAKTPLARFHQLALQGKIQGQTVQVLSGQFSAVPQAQSVTGTVTFDGDLALKLHPSMLQIGGTLARPVPHPAPQRSSGAGTQ